MPVVYDELRRIAARYVSRERPGQTLQATALVNEAFVRLAHERPREFQNRTHFLAIAALSMRQILVQRARARKAAKRGGAPHQVTLSDDNLVRRNVDAPDAPALGPGRASIDLEALDEALNRLAEIDPEQARIVELRYHDHLPRKQVGPPCRWCPMLHECDEGTVALADGEVAAIEADIEG